MNFLQSLKQHFTVKQTILATVLFAGLMLAASAGAAINPGSIPYQGEDTPPASEPAFNVYSGVPGMVGNEADFLRVKQAEEANDAYRNTVDTVCENGDMFDVWFYVHNGASADLNDNGNGPSVAKDVNVRVDLDNADESDRFDLRGFISSSNAMNISDGATIDCGDKKFKLSYVADSAQAFLDLPNELVNLPEGIVGNGTPIGTNALDGNVWGCWDQRVWIGLKVVVEEVKEPELYPAVCTGLTITGPVDRRITVENVSYELNDATLNSITINYGDGTEVVAQPNDFPLDAHTYENAGEYTVVATLNTTFKGEPMQVTDKKCKQKFTFEKEVVTACKMLTASRSSAAVGEEIVFNAEGMADGTDITGYVFSVNGEEAQNSDSDTFTLTVTEAGDYDVKVEVVFANGDRKSNEDCEKTVTFVEEEEPIYICKSVIATPVQGSDKREYTIKVTTEQSNATVKDYIYNFGDGSDELVTTNDEVTYTYSDELEGEFTITVDVRFNVSEEVVTVEAGRDCTDSVTFEKDVEKCPIEGKEDLDKDDPDCREEVKSVKKKRTLPNTGAGSVAGAFAALTAAGTIGHSLITRRKQ